MAMTTVRVLAIAVLFGACNSSSPGAETSAATKKPITTTRKPTTTTTKRPAVRCATPEAKTTVAYASIPDVAANATSLDVYAPAESCGAPVVMWVHGGGYHTGDKRHQVKNKAKLMTDRGWLFLSVNYRLTAAGVATSAHFPDHYVDVATAVAWVNAHISEFGGDPTRIALLGHSAGADIVANVTTNPTYLANHGLDLDAVVCAGPLDTEGFDKATAGSGGSAERGAWLDALGNAPDYEHATSATTLIRPGIGIPTTIGVVRGTPRRRMIEQTYLDRLTGAGVTTAAIDAAGLSHAQVNARIGAPDDTVMTPPLMTFLDGCFLESSAAP